MGGARIHSSAKELVFKRHGPPVLADNRGHIIMFYIYSTLSRCLKTSTSTNNHKEYERLHGPHSNVEHSTLRRHFNVEMAAPKD